MKTPCMDNPALFDSTKPEDHLKARVHCTTACPRPSACLLDALRWQARVMHDASYPDEKKPHGTLGGVLFGAHGNLHNNTAVVMA